MPIYKDISVNKIVPSPENRDVDPSTSSYASLVASMREHGFVGNIIVRPKGDGQYEIVDGHHRYEAAIEAKVETIPCIVSEIDDTKAALMRFLCNENRRNLTGYDHYVMVTKMRENGMKRNEIAKAVGKSVEWVKKVLYLNTAPDYTKELARMEGWTFSKFISETTKAKSQEEVMETSRRNPSATSSSDPDNAETPKRTLKASRFWLSKSLKWTKEMAKDPAMECVIDVASRTGVELEEGKYYDVQVAKVRLHDDGPLKTK